MMTSTPTLPILISPRLRSPRGGLVVAGRHYRGGAFLPQAARPALEVAAALAARASTTAEVVIGILGRSYGVAALPIDPSIGTAAFLLMPLDRPTAAYHVHRDRSGRVECTCPDHVFRRSAAGAPCKHARRLAELALMPSPVPTVLPPLAHRPAGPAARPRRFEPSPADVQAAAEAFGWR